MKKTLSILTIFMLISLPLLVGAQDNNGVPTVGGDSGQVAKVIQNIITFVTNFVFIIAVLFIIYAAYLYLTSSGDEEKVKEARKIITYAIVGVIIAVVAKGIVALIASRILDNHSV